MECPRPTLQTAVSEIFTLAQKAELYITSYSVCITVQWNL